MQAAQLNSEECVRVLLSYHANETLKDKSGHSAYDLAPENIRTLLNPVNSTERTITQYIESGNSRQLEIFLKSTNRSGINDQIDYLGLTPLMLAVVKEQYDCARVLLKFKADQSIKDQMGHTAYDRASDRFKEILDKSYSTHSKAGPTIIPSVNPIYATPDHTIKVEVDGIKTNERKGNEELFFGSFIALGREHNVVVKINSNLRSLEKEAKLFKEI